MNWITETVEMPRYALWGYGWFLIGLVNLLCGYPDWETWVFWGVLGIVLMLIGGAQTVREEYGHPRRKW